jgi:hypothetical protein
MQVAEAFRQRTEAVLVAGTTVVVTPDSLGSVGTPGPVTLIESGEPG